MGPTGPMEFGWSNGSLTYLNFYSQIRMRYAMGVQVLIQLQCTMLVEDFDVNEKVVEVASADEGISMLMKRLSERDFHR